MVVKLYNNT